MISALRAVDGSPAPLVVQVPLRGRSYDILIGRSVLEDGAARVAALGIRAAGLVVDAAVADSHGVAVREALVRHGLRVETVVVPSGEPSKSFAELERVCDALIAARMERGDAVVALGGGVVGDLAGLASALVLRGLRLVQMPTTLLAQVDSSVGGKTGINTRQGKNLVGVFRQPGLVVAETGFLDSLDARQMRAGYAEIVKYGLIDDLAFFAWCEANWAAVLAGGPEREHAVAIACRAKARVVAEDEEEHGTRALLNLGHTFGHALERAVGYDPSRLVHGEAVAIGLALAARFSVKLGLLTPDDGARVSRHLAAVGLPTRLSDVPGGCGTAADLLAAMAQDKKVRSGRLTFILLRAIGRAFEARGVDAGSVREFLDAELAG